MRSTCGSFLLAFATTLVGCEAAPVSTRAATTKASAPVADTKPSTPTDDGPAPMAWGNAIAWQGWDSALRTAERERRAIALVVYASWCPHCKELAPEFSRPAVAHAAAGLIMVHQDQDASAPWLKERFAAYGDYIPRVLFLRPDGSVREDLQSGHPRYPYFYAPMVTDRLVANMLAATVP